MKKIFLWLCLSYFAVEVQAQGGSLKTTFDAVALYIAAGDTDALVEYFSNTVECELLNEHGVYSKIQAKLVFKFFFEKHMPISFSFKHSSDKQIIKYAIGILRTRGGNSLRVTVFIKQENDTMKICQLRIDNEE